MGEADEMSSPQDNWESIMGNHLIAEQREFNPQEQQQLAEEQILNLNQEKKAAFDTVVDSFFDALDPLEVDLCQKVLLSYAEKDWSEVVNIINMNNIQKVVDIGGGFGFLAKSIKDKYPDINCFVVEKHQVVQAYSKYLYK